MLVAPEKIPVDVITINSRVVLSDLEENSCLELTLIYPTDTQVEGKVSMLAPIGTAMLGYRVGDKFEWDTPAGKASPRVYDILYQPESTGVYD